MNEGSEVRMVQVACDSVENGTLYGVDKEGIVYQYHWFDHTPDAGEEPKYKKGWEPLVMLAYAKK